VWQQQQQLRQRKLQQLQLLAGSAGVSSSSGSSGGGRGGSSCQQPAVTLGDVVVLLYCCVQLGYRPSDSTMAAAVSAAAMGCWGLLSQQQQQFAGSSSARHNHAWLGPGPAAVGAWESPVPAAAAALQQVTAAALCRMDSFSCSDVGLLFWGLARLRHSCSFERFVCPLVVHFLARVDDTVVAAPAICNVVHALPLLHRWPKSLRALKQRLGFLLPQLAAAAQLRMHECGPRELGAADAGLCTAEGSGRVTSG